MLLFLLDLLSEHVRGLSAFTYITLRAVMASLTALGIGLVLGPWVIRR
ncbi:MAG: MraY, partial [Pseudomonadota bacterium]